MDSLRHILPFFIPITAIVMGIGIGMLGLYLDYQKKIRMYELHHQERILAIERGMEVPELPAEFFSSGRKPALPPGSGSLRWGLICLFVGMALAVAMALNDGAQQASWALLPVAVGLALLVHYKVDKQAAPAPADDQPTAS